jgi:hypothetical protein
MYVIGYFTYLSFLSKYESGCTFVFCEILISFVPLHILPSVSSLGVVTPATEGTTCTTAHHSTADTATPPQHRTLTCTPLLTDPTLSTATNSW